METLLLQLDQVAAARFISLVESWVVNNFVGLLHFQADMK